MLLFGCLFNLGRVGKVLKDERALVEVIFELGHVCVGDGE